MKPKCEDCKWYTYHPYIMVGEGTSYHACHKNAPMPRSDPDNKHGTPGEWAYVSCDDFCGEFERKIEEGR